MRHPNCQSEKEVAKFHQKTLRDSAQKAKLFVTGWRLTSKVRVSKKGGNASVNVSAVGQAKDMFKLF
jgi:hypothetical protein